MNNKKKKTKFAVPKSTLLNSPQINTTTSCKILNI